MKKISSLLILLLLTSGLVYAQDYTFKVLVNKGDNQVKKESGTMESLKTGAELFDLEEIVSSAGAYIGLMHKSGKTAEIKGASTTKVTDLAATINTAATSSASRYTQFIAAKMSERERTGNRDRTNTIGAVSRGLSELVVLLPNTSLEVFSDEAVLRWIGSDEEEEELNFTVTMSDVFGEVVYTEQTQENFVNVNFAEIENESGFYIFKVHLTDNEGIASEEFGIKKLKADEKPAVAEGLGTLLTELTDDSPLNKLVLASFYEENGLLLDALTQYEQAVRSNPEVEDFQSIYDAFLINNGMVPEEE